MSAACGIGLLATSGWFITRAAEHPPVFVLSIAIGSVQAFALGRGIARYLQRLSVHDLTLEVLGKLRLSLFDHLEPVVPGGLRETSGVFSGFVTDAESVVEAFSKEVTATVDITASIFLGAVIACLIQPQVGIVLVVGALGVVGVSFVTARVGRLGAAREAESRADLAGTVIETMRAAPELIAFGREDLVETRLDAVRRATAGAALSRAVATGLGRAAGIWVSGGALVAIVIEGLHQNRSGHLSATMFAAVVFTALAVFDQCATLPAVLAEKGSGDVAARRVTALSELSPPAPEPERALIPPSGPLTASLREAGVTFGTIPLLDGLSLDVVPGRRVALVGRSGSGKTTALHSLLHFVECTHGQALLGRVDVRHMSRDGIAERLGWMTQRSPRLCGIPRRQSEDRKSAGRRCPMR